MSGRFIRAATVVVAVCLLAVGCSDDQPDQSAGSPTADECRDSAAALDDERPGLDVEYQTRLDEWLALEAEREALDAEQAALEDSKSVYEDTKADTPESGDSEAADASKAAWTSAIALGADWDRLEVEWARIEAKLEVFIDAAAEAPAAADWPLDPRRHSDRWPDLFEHRAALNDEWSDLARSMSDLFEQMSDLYRQAAAADAFGADLATQLSDQLERRADLYDRYAASTTLWSDHWQAETTWHQQASDLAWDCRQA